MIMATGKRSKSEEEAIKALQKELGYTREMAIKRIRAWS